MREWLITNYGGASHIVNDTIMALAKRKKPAANDHSERYSRLSAIPAALQWFEKLTKTNPALGVELNDCLYSCNTLTSLSKLLVALDYDEYIQEMTRRALDWRNPLGKETYDCCCWSL